MRGAYAAFLECSYMDELRRDMVEKVLKQMKVGSLVLMYQVTDHTITLLLARSHKRVVPILLSTRLF